MSSLKSPSNAVVSVSAGVRSLCVVNQEALQTGCPTNLYLARFSLYTQPIALCSAFPSPLSLPHVPNTRLNTKTTGFVAAQSVFIFLKSTFWCPNGVWTNDRQTGLTDNSRDIKRRLVQ